MSHIFVSYAHDDEAIVKPIVDNLKRHFRIWIDSAGIKQGDDWYETIQENLAGSVAILVFISNQSKERPWVLHELDEGKKHNIPCHPYLIESISKIPKVIREKQFIDGSKEGAFEQLMDELPQTARHQGNTVINSNFIGSDKKFTTVADSLPGDDTCLDQFQNVKYGIKLIGLPLELTRYCKIYLIGRAEDTLESTDKIQLCVLMSGRNHGDYKVVIDAANNMLTRPDFPLRMLLVEGPPKSDPSYDAQGYFFDPERPDEWRDAYRAIKKALNIYPAANPQIFFNGPGVLLYPIGADRRDQADFELFQLKYGSNPPRYFPVLWHKLIFGS